MKKHLLLILLISSCIFSYSQNNVGVGTLTPNPNAALEIESTDKGLLIPRLTTAQRNIFGVGLTNTENSMLVYDVNDYVFYYWKATVWVPIPGINTDDQNIDSVILNPDSTLTVYIEDGLSASVDLKTAFDNTDEQTLNIVGDSLEISNGNKVLFIDNDTTNEKIDSVIYQNDTLTVYEGDSVYKTEITGGEWSDADKIGLTNFIYANQALNNGTNDTVVITDKGNIGVGFTRPTSKIQAFEYYDTTQLITPFVSNADRLPGISVYDYSDFIGITTVDKDNNPATRNEADGMLYWGDDAGTEDLRFAYISYNLGTGRLEPQDKMIIKGTGNVGIGISAPIEKLHVKGEIKSELNGGNRSGILLDPTVSDMPKISFRASNDNNRFEILSYINVNTWEDNLHIRSIVNAPNDVADTIITFNGGSGNVGVATTKPQSKLSILNEASGGTNTDGLDNSILYINNGNSADGSIIIKSHGVGLGNSIGALKFHSSPDAVNYNSAAIKALAGVNAEANTLAFYTSNINTQANAPNEVMRIERGDMGIGTSNPISKLHVTGNGVYTGTTNSPTSVSVQPLGDIGIPIVHFRGVVSFNAFYDNDSLAFVSHDDGGASNKGAVIYHGAGNGIGISILPTTTGLVNQKNSSNDIIAKSVVYIEPNAFKPTFDNTIALGTAVNRWTEVFATNGVVNTSDKRHKTNINPLSYGLDEVLKIKTVSYNWRDNDNGKRLGFIAQDLQYVIPEVISVANDSVKTLGVRYTELIPVLTKAIQEQQEIINELKSESKLKDDKLNSLESEINKIKELLNKK
jgi:hypothetical protein